jgi:hypothetical protein
MNTPNTSNQGLAEPEPAKNTDAYGKETILQLIPAGERWFGRFKDEEKGEQWLEKVLAWALIERDDGCRYVRAIYPDEDVEQHDPEPWMGYKQLGFHWAGEIPELPNN